MSTLRRLNGRARHNEYIHTYKFGEAVEDGVVLDLVCEARDIDQTLGSVDKIDAWFEAKTKGLNDWQKDELKKQWGTMQNVLSSRSRMERVVSDIIFDFSVKPRLSNHRGNAILVASSIYEACKYYDLLQKTPFKGRCAVVTSYNPQAKDITKEETGANTETDKQFIYNTYTELLKNVVANPGKSKTETYEDAVKALFSKEPANMKLLVVVDKLLTGFDAPPCTYLYIDKSMQDHGLFQAICRTNRLDGEDKDFGYIVDYKDLFKNLVNDKGTGALQVYSSELDHSAGGADPEVLMQDRLKKGKERLDNALEERQPQRVAFYKATVALVIKQQTLRCPPDGKVKIAAPTRMSLDTIRVFAISKLAWIRRQQNKLREQERETPREYLNLESHYVWGKQYLLSIAYTEDALGVFLQHSKIVLRAKPGTDTEQRQAILEEWYRKILKEAAQPLIAKWEANLGVKVKRLFVQRMKTKWGSCN